jgi:CheY-like chemotaxis protein
MESSVITMLRYIGEGRITVDKRRNTESFTYHDSCNNGRSCGMFEEPRELLRLVADDFREMYPNRAENFCCTGGGGAMSMSEYTPRRLKSASVKAGQLKATGADFVVTSCHNCVDGLGDCIKHYQLPMKVTQLVNMVAKAAVVPEKKVVVTAAAKPQPAGALAGFKILVADDEPDALTFLATVLADEGAQVIRAIDGDEALAKAQAEKPDLITLDLSMPGKNGSEVFEALRKDPALAGIKVCIVTGRPELRRFIYERPVPPPEGYLDKPVDGPGLLLNVRKILGLHDALN